MGLSPEGVKIGFVAKRAGEEERWSTAGWDQLRGLPWNVAPERREADVAVEAPGFEVPVRLPAQPQPLQPEESEAPVRRQFYVKKADVAKYLDACAPGAAIVGAGSLCQQLSMAGRH